MMSVDMRTCDDAQMRRGLLNDAKEAALASAIGRASTR